jgi:16S rRNA (guanine527-N7)-methyltransferase
LFETDARAARAALERLLPATDALGLPPRFGDDAERFVGLLLDANTRLNLTRVVEPAAIARLHLLDSLAALPLLDGRAPRSAVDLGSGGGIPGLVLAMARPGMSWTLVDSVGKKADALRSFVSALGLTGVQVLAERAEAIGRDPAHRGGHDLVTARACAALPVVAELALPLLRKGGTLIAWKGPIADAELRSGAAAARILGGSAPEAVASGFDELGDHRFVVVRKLAPTPSAYPRRPGVPARRPLG